MRQPMYPSRFLPQAKKASGTGNMKFMLNGASTLGTMDGANVEIVEEVGEENAFIFGLSSDEVIDLSITTQYNPREIYNMDSDIRAVLTQLLMEPMHRKTGIWSSVRFTILCWRVRAGAPDMYFILKDFRSYAEAQKKLKRHKGYGPMGKDGNASDCKMR